MGGPLDSHVSTKRGANWLAGVGSGDEFAAADGEAAADEDEADAFGELGRVFVGGVVRDAVRIEDGDVGIGSHADAAFVAHLRDACLETYGGHEGHLADGVHQREGMFLANVAGKDPGKCTGGAGVAGVVFDIEAIGGDEGERAEDGEADALFGVGMDDDVAADLAVFEERLASEPFAGGGPLDPLVVFGGAVHP